MQAAGLPAATPSNTPSSRHGQQQRPSPVAPHAQQPTARRPRCRCIARTSLYDLLGVTSGASTAQIRGAYRRLAAHYHPDANSSLVAHEKFQALNLAAEVLTSELRAQYDSRGVAALPASRYRFLLEFLRNASGTAAGASLLGEPGGDISTVLGVDFSEAVTGTEASVTTGALGACPDCKGRGHDPTHTATDCRVCRGSGEILVRRWDQHQHHHHHHHHHHQHDSGSGGGGSSLGGDDGPGGPIPVLALPQACPACRGSGKSDTQECKRCAGEGRVQLRRRVRFKVPAGVVDGQVLRVRGQGHSGKFGGAPGDLLVRLQVYDLADVTRRGYDLHSGLVVPLYEALLGASMPVTTVRGPRLLQVPAGTQHGQRLCVRGAGVARPGVNGVEYGHHFFEVTVQVPSADAVSPPELQLLQQLASVHQQQRQQEQAQEPQGARWRHCRTVRRQQAADGAQPADDEQQEAARRGGQPSGALEGQQQQGQQRQDPNTIAGGEQQAWEPP